MKTILIYSGGLDSTVLLFHLRDEGHGVKALGIDYGQRHRRELDHAQGIASDIGVPFRVADLSPLGPFLAGSSQTSDLEVPEGHYADESMKLTVVPNRNMLMLSVAIAWAVSTKADAVAYAAHAGDHAIYPDCRPEFAKAMDEAARLCDWSPVELFRPFIGMTKADIVRRGAELAVPFEKTWSCYKGLDAHCGKCGTCVERREAFKVSGVKDATQYASGARSV